MRTKGLLTILALAATAPAWAQDGCAHRAPRNLDLATNGGRTLVVRTGAGELDIQGDPGARQVRARGTACADREEDLAQIRLVQRREGDRLVLATEFPDSGSWFGGQRSLDLELRVPAGLALEVDDSSGDATIEGVASLRAQDSSGDLRIARVAGHVWVDDSSGELEVRDVGSLLVASDSSGEIRAEGVRGDAEVADDSSGSILLRRIGGNAKVGSDSSGDIVAEDVGGDFVVEDDGSGSIEHHGVRGQVRIPDKD